MQQWLTLWGGHTRGASWWALVGVCAALAFPAGAAADWSKPPTTVTRHGESGSFGPALGDDGLLRVPWLRGRTIGVALLSHGRVVRRFVVDRKPSEGRPTAVAALPGGRTAVQYESGSRIVLATFNRRGKRLHARRFSGGMGGIQSTPPLISRGPDGAAACWVAGRANDPSLSVALISPTGAIGQRLTVSSFAGADTNTCTITRGQRGDVVATWAQSRRVPGPRRRGVSSVLVRTITSDGQVGPEITARPETEPGNVTFDAPTAAVTDAGDLGVVWTVSEGPRRAHHRMRWIAADGTTGPAVDLDAPSRIPGRLALEPSGDGVVAIITEGDKTVTAVDVSPDGTVGSSRTLLSARRSSFVASASNGQKVVLAVQAVTRKRSSIYVIERDGPDWGQPVRLASGGGARWPYAASAAVNADGVAAVAWSVERGVAPLASLGVRAVASG
jgi:hypothetical protein